MKKLVNALIVSLNEIEVKGKKNMDTLLGCIQALERLQEIIDGGVYHERKSEGENVSSETDSSGQNG